MRKAPQYMAPPAIPRKPRVGPEYQADIPVRTLESRPIKRRGDDTDLDPTSKRPEV